MKKLLQLVLVLALVGAMQAQDSRPKPVVKVYRVNFNIYELEDGKKTNERNYSLPVNSMDGIGRSGSIRVGTRVPISSGKDQILYLDVGMNMECEISEQSDKFILTSSLEISSFVLPDQNADSRTGGNPVIRQVKQHFTALLSPGKPTLVTSIDDTASKKRLQVEATVTRVE
ncbi:MAG TPA: hypothetical protein VNW97_13260 [Candidatus Saccharimonadales bacterium]|jgi:hypothetical protein|nr:hypothetical protein [Candidatus Saccharimonadales bacterium]